MDKATTDHFATVSVSPRSIAWLVRPEERDRLERIVNYNCAMLGGWFNVLIPLTEEGISTQYKEFLIDYDPDLIVLAEERTSFQLSALPPGLNPYAYVPWESVSQIANLQPLDCSSLQNLPPRLPSSIQTNPTAARSWKVAIASNEQPDTSLLALIACGDVVPAEPRFYGIDDFETMAATDYRETLLMAIANPAKRSLIAVRQEDERRIPAASREDLAGIIRSEHAFPLTGVVDILETCDYLQAYPDDFGSFVGVTSQYRKTGTTTTNMTSEHTQKPPALVVLVSEHFRFDEAVMFWNLRARGVRVVWIAFSQLEHELLSVCQWLESDLGGVTHLIRGDGIAFSCIAENFEQLSRAVERLATARQARWPEWKVHTHPELVAYGVTRPIASYERVDVALRGSQCSLVTQLEHISIWTPGMVALTIDWSSLKIPKDKRLVEESVSSETVLGDVPMMWQLGDNPPTPLRMPRFRVTQDRNLRVQINDDNPIHFNRPSALEVFGVLFRSAGLRLEPSSAARYHRVFVDRASSLEEAAGYLSTSPYRQLLETLANNSDKMKPGWLLEYPDKRRALHHLHLRDALQSSTPELTRKYFDSVCDELPAEAARLLENQLLERGFLMKCETCSYRAWYPVQHIGQQFECYRCLQSQVYLANPTWLYKLPEVIFQGFADNMQVPLLALNYFRKTTRNSFDWVPDSNVRFTENGKEVQRNIDILCLRDGKVYLGEAKSCDHIDTEKLNLYEDLSRRIDLDGLVFATSTDRWDRKALERMQELANRCRCKVIVLTSKELYGT